MATKKKITNIQTLRMMKIFRVFFTLQKHDLSSPALTWHAVINLPPFRYTSYSSGSQTFSGRYPLFIHDPCPSFPSPPQTHNNNPWLPWLSYSPTLIRHNYSGWRIEFVSVYSNLTGKGVWVEAAGGPMQGDHCCVCVLPEAQRYCPAVFLPCVFVKGRGNYCKGV